MSETNISQEQEAPSLLPPANDPPATTQEIPEWINDALAGSSEDERKQIMAHEGVKNLKTPASMLKSWTDSQSMIGKIKSGQYVVKPGKTATPEQLTEFYNAIGRPEKADDYEITLPEGVDPEKVQALYPKFHEWGLTQKQAESAVSYMLEAGMSAQQAEAAQAEEASRARRNEVLDKMKLAYGPNYETYIGYAQGEVAKVLKDDPAMTEEIRARYERDPAVIKLAVELTRHNAPDRLRVPEGGGASTTNSVTVQSLEADLDVLRKELGEKGYEAHQYNREPRVVKIKEQIRALKKAARAS